ncbi:MAG: hypothetical protein EOP10_09310 [Proteobacteria bacterium]|nr:MAG: hypothetical protein EOP10_09310 [Pseudomonadota bacterium]
MRISLALLATTSLFFGACGENQSVENSQSKALVTEAQAGRAFEIVKAIDYIPFTYIVDGCYARSLYMSMELAAKEIPSSAYYIFGYLQPTESVSWGYHVAPALKIKGGESWILDPAFENEPLSLAAWQAKNNPQGDFQNDLKAGSAYFDPTGRTSEFNMNNMVQNFEEMPTFLTSDIASACTVMYQYIPLQKQTPSQSNAQRAKLVARTVKLVDALQNNGKLENDGVNSDANSVCRNAAVSASR